MKLKDHVTHYQRDAELFDYFEKRSGADKDSTRRIQQGVFHAAQPKNNDTLLDIGSGNGWVADECRKRTLPPPVLVDIGIINLQRIKKMHGDYPLLVAADACHLPFREGSFSCIIASEVLEHINEPETTLQQIRPLLRERGRLILSTPYKEKLKYSLCIHCNHMTPHNAHLHSFDEELHSSMLKAAGFNDIHKTLHLNKLLLFTRIYQLFSFVPYIFWRAIDAAANMILGRAAVIIVTATPQKKETT